MSSTQLGHQCFTKLVFFKRKGYKSFSIRFFFFSGTRYYVMHGSPTCAGNCGEEVQQLHPEAAGTLRHGKISANQITYNQPVSGVILFLQASLGEP